MTDLSPAAIAVLEAVHLAMAHQQASLSGVPDYRQVTAAALRAVADQDETLFDVEEEMVPAVRAVRTDRLLSIAAELEGANG